jgi:hypothetical protein
MVPGLNLSFFIGLYHSHHLRFDNIFVLQYAVIDTDGNPPEMAEDPPFDVALSGNVGIFGYEITRYFDRGGGGDGCLAYDENFGQQKAYPSVATAQFCALLAPIFAGIGIFACAVDCCVCNFGGSFLCASLFFAIACGLQAGTFTLLADPAFW